MLLMESLRPAIIKENDMFKKAVIWGHPLHSHTHSYIHNSFYKAFKHLGYETYWLNNDSDISNLNLDNALFITEGQVDKKMPLLNSSFYVLHNCYNERYNNLKNKCSLQVYTDDCTKYGYTKLDTCHYADYNGKCLYQPWATDLLPHEIELNKPSVVFNEQSNIINWVGTVGAGEFGNINEITPFSMTASHHGITFKSMMNISMEDSVKLIKESYMAPTILGTWQHNKNYIPCRIFKNISYGQPGLTNSYRIYELFDGNVIHHDKTDHLFYSAKEAFAKMQLNELHSLMDLVAQKHTYINRIQSILDFVEKVK